MIRSIAIRLVLFFILAVGATGGLVILLSSHNFLSGSYTVYLQMPDSGGLFVHALVTNRGVRIGSVTALNLTGQKGVRATLTIDSGRNIPVGTPVVIKERSPIGEEYVNFEPTKTSGPYLRDGGVVGPDLIRAPVPFATLLNHLNALGLSINTSDLATVVDEVSTGLTDAGPRLSRILDDARTVLSDLQRVAPQTVDLLQTAGQVLDTVNGERQAIQQFAASAHQLADAIVAVKDQIPPLLQNADNESVTLAGIINDNQPALGQLLGNLITTANILDARLPAVKELLVAIPAAGGAIQATVNGNQARFALQGTIGPECTYGTSQRLPTDHSPRPPNDNAYCTQYGPTLQQRGAYNAPRPPGDDTATPGGNLGPAGEAAVVGYDPVTRVVTAPDGQTAMLGSSGGQDTVLGDDSWAALLLELVR